MTEQKNESKYAKKRASGRQMYGPGCCTHKVTSAQVERAAEAARQAGHFHTRAVWREGQSAE